MKRERALVPFLVVMLFVVVVCAAPRTAQAAAQDPGAQGSNEEEQPTGNGAERKATKKAAKREPWAGPMSQLLWMDGQTGIEAVQLKTFFANFDTFAAGLLPASGVGPTARIGAGLRFGFLTLGARGRVASFEDSSTVGSWQIWTLDGELGVRVPLYRLEPHITFAAGYSSFGGFSTAVNGLQDGLDVHGVDARLGVGVDYWVTHHISIGVDANGELIAIARPGVSVRDLAVAKQIGTLDDAKARILEASGSTVGTGVSLTGALGLHF